MSSALSRQIKWSAFLLFPMLFMASHSPATAIDPARCEKHCDDNRPKGSTLAYNLNCTEKYESEKEVDECKSLCESCTIEICSKDDPNIYKCPSSVGPSLPIVGRCKARCDLGRKGNEEPYELSCKNVFNDSHIQSCRFDCLFCSRHICNPYKPDIFNCPRGFSKCEQRCNKKRPKGSQEAFQFSCQSYLIQNEIDKCIDDCKNCPEICSSNLDTYNCPFFKITRRCEDFCKASRGDDKNKSSRAYTIRCEADYYLDEDYCQSYCRDCGEVCVSRDPGEYHCPADYDPFAKEPELDTEESSDESGELSSLAIVGIVLGVLLVVLVVGGIIFSVIRKKRKGQDQTQLGGIPTTGGMVYQAKVQNEQQQQSPMTLEPNPSSLSMGNSPSSSESSIPKYKK